MICSCLCSAKSFSPSSPRSSSHRSPSPSNPDDAVEAVRNLEQYREGLIPLWMNDFGNLGRYREANAKLGLTNANEDRVVFMGDSITDIWKLDKSFPGKPYINRGIGGQTTPQMLIRFRPDVIDLDPKVVVILAGTNDIAGNTGPMTLEEIEANMKTMTETCPRARHSGSAVFRDSS